MDDDQAQGLASGVLLLIVGVWLISRTLVHDANGLNLVDRIVAYAGGSGSGSSGDDTGVGVHKGAAGLPNATIKPPGTPGEFDIPGTGFGVTPPQINPIPHVTKSHKLDLPFLPAPIPGIPHIRIPLP